MYTISTRHTSRIKQSWALAFHVGFGSNKFPAAYTKCAATLLHDWICLFVPECPAPVTWSIKPHMHALRTYFSNCCDIVSGRWSESQGWAASGWLSNHKLTVASQITVFEHVAFYQVIRCAEAPAFIDFTFLIGKLIFACWGYKKKQKWVKSAVN